MMGVWRFVMRLSYKYYGWREITPRKDVLLNWALSLCWSIHGDNWFVETKLFKAAGGDGHITADSSEHHGTRW